MSSSPLTDFEIRIDNWVLDAIDCAVRQHTFGSLVRALPGVYPASVAESVRRLGLRIQVPKPSGGSIRRRPPAHPPALALPHPFDSTWRFDRRTQRLLANAIASLNRQRGRVALLGTPTLVGPLVDVGIAPERLVVVDRDEAVLSDIRKRYACEAIESDLTAQDPGGPISSVVVIDPPWYMDQFECFVRAAGLLSSCGGYLIASVPPSGTRASATADRRAIVRFAQENGFALIGELPGILSYQTPLFESNALSAASIGEIDDGWRRADMMWFRREVIVTAERPSVVPSDAWDEVIIGSVRIRIRARADSSMNPLLLGLADDEIVASVSRNDIRRQQADVWTSGNRGYTTEAPGLVCAIARACRESESSISRVELLVGFRLNASEAERVVATERQLRRIVEVEEAEYETWANGGIEGVAMDQAG